MHARILRPFREGSTRILSRLQTMRQVPLEKLLINYPMNWAGGFTVLTLALGEPSANKKNLPLSTRLVELPSHITEGFFSGVQMGAHLAVSRYALFKWPIKTVAAGTLALIGAKSRIETEKKEENSKSNNYKF